MLSSCSVISFFSFSVLIYRKRRTLKKRIDVVGWKVCEGVGEIRVGGGGKAVASVTKCDSQLLVESQALYVGQQ